MIRTLFVFIATLIFLSSFECRAFKTEQEKEFLLLVDVSLSMKKLKDKTRQDIFDAISSGFDNSIKQGSQLGIWVFNENVLSEKYGPKVWDPLLNMALARNADNFIKALSFSKTTRFASLLRSLYSYAPSVKQLVAIIYTDGDSRIEGTPFDMQINDALGKNKKLYKQSRKPVVLGLIFQEGKMIDWFVKKPEDSFAQFLKEKVTSEQIVLPVLPKTDSEVKNKTNDIALGETSAQEKDLTLIKQQTKEDKTSVEIQQVTKQDQLESKTITPPKKESSATTNLVEKPGEVKKEAKPASVAVIPVNKPQSESKLDTNVEIRTSKVKVSSPAEPVKNIHEIIDISPETKDTQTPKIPAVLETPGGFATFEPARTEKKQSPPPGKTEIPVENVQKLLSKNATTEVATASIDKLTQEKQGDLKTSATNRIGSSYSEKGIVPPAQSKKETITNLSKEASLKAKLVTSAQAGIKRNYSGVLAVAGMSLAVVIGIIIWFYNRRISNRRQSLISQSMDSGLKK
jgi:hypothetical protein